MQAAIYYQSGEPDVLTFVAVPDPVVRDGEIVIRVEAISIEGGDLLSRRYMPQESPPTVPGYSAAGEVVVIGDDVTGFAVGDKVTSFGFRGAYGELRAVSAACCWVVPRGMDMQAAAAVPVAFGTAALALSLGGLKAGETMLLLGANGGVGIAAIQLANLAGARVIGSGRDAASLEVLQQYGLRGAVIAGHVPISEQVQSLLGEGVDLLVDNVGGAAFQDGVGALKDGGRGVIVGIAGPGDKTIDTTQLLTRRLSIFGCFLGPIMCEPQYHDMISGLLKRVASGELLVPIDKVYPLREAAAAHAHAELSGRVGRVIMIP